MGIAGRELLSQRRDFRTDTVELHDGTVIRVRELRGNERAHVLDVIKTAVDMQTRQMVSFAKQLEANAWAIRYGWIDEAGEQICTDSDVEMIAEWPAEEWIDPIADRIGELSGMSRTQGSGAQDDVVDDVEDAKKNSAAILSNGSGTS